MGTLYLAALLLGFGTIALQLFSSVTSDAELGSDAGPNVGAGSDLHAQGGAEGAHSDASLLGSVSFVFLSIRFWTFALLSFGLTGALLHYLRLTGPTATLSFALVMGLASGVLASWVFRVLGRRELSSGTTSQELVGQLGRVLLSCAPERSGKIRMQLKGQTLDLVATTDEALLEPGAWVLVDELRGRTAHVSLAPKEFLPKDA